jgi:hypothetical protein
MTLSELLARFDEVWLCDTEFISKPGERPDVVCLCAKELKSGRTLRLWRTQLGAAPPYRVDASVLHVHFVSNAECSSHLSLGWPLPARVIDLSPEFRNLMNGCPTPHGKGLARRGAPPIREIYKVDYKGSPVQATDEPEVIEAEAVEVKAER